MSGLMESAWEDERASGSDTADQSGRRSVAQRGKSIYYWHLDRRPELYLHLSPISYSLGLYFKAVAIYIHTLQM